MNMWLNRARQRLGLSVLLLLLGPADLSLGQEAPPADEQRDEQFRRLILGTWEDDYQGKRTMTIRPDGTATMVVELRGAKALLYASRLEFDMKWSLARGHLKKQTVGGKPPGRVKLILKTMGDRVNEPILELTHERLVLLDGDGKRKYTWKRVPKDGDPDENPS